MIQLLTALSAHYMDTPDGYCPECHKGGVIAKLQKDSTHDFFGNDTGEAMCCPNCTYCEDIEPSYLEDRYDDSLSYA